MPFADMFYKTFTFIFFVSIFTKYGLTQSSAAETSVEFDGKKFNEIFVKINDMNSKLYRLAHDTKNQLKSSIAFEYLENAELSFDELVQLKFTSNERFRLTNIVTTTIEIVENILESIFKRKVEDEKLLLQRCFAFLSKIVSNFNMKIQRLSKTNISFPAGLFISILHTEIVGKNSVSNVAINLNPDLKDDNQLTVEVSVQPNQELVLTFMKITDSFNYFTDKSLLYNSPILFVSAISIVDNTTVHPDMKFLLRAKHGDPLQRGDKPQCRSLDLWADELWSENGCILDETYTNIIQTVCQCKVGNYFAALNDISERQEAKVITPKALGPTPPSTQSNSTVNQKLIDDIHQIQKTASNITKDEWLNKLDDINNLISDAVNNTAKLNMEQVKNITEISLKGASKMIENVPHDWNSNSTQNQTLDPATSILYLVQNISYLLNVKQSQDQHPFKYQQTFDSIEVQSKKIIKTNETEFHEPIKFYFKHEQIELPIESLIGLEDDSKKPNKSKQVAVTIVVVNHLKPYLSSGELLVNSRIISVIVGKDQHHNETIKLRSSNKLKFTSKNLDRLEFYDTPKCEFWNFSSSSWSTNGCFYNRLDSNRSFTVCECDHLTNFAALMDVSHREGPSLAKNIMTYTFCGLNCLFILMAIYVALKFNRKHYVVAEDRDKKLANQHSITLNIAFGLLVSNVLIMAGMDRTENKIICGTISLMLLMSLLATFTFMFLLSFHRLMVDNNLCISMPINYKHYAMIGYLLPLVIILFALITIHFSETQNVEQTIQSMRGEYFCWISSIKHPNHIFIFVAPATFLALLNLLVFIYLIMIIIRINILKPIKSKIRRTLSKESTSDEVKKLLTNSYFLLFNFGIPWILYVLYINEFFRHFSYVFIGINGTQGIALFVEQVYIYKNSQKTKKMYRSRRRRSSD